MAVAVASRMPSTPVRALIAGLSRFVWTGMRGFGWRPPGQIVGVGGDLSDQVTWQPRAGGRRGAGCEGHGCSRLRISSWRVLGDLLPIEERKGPDLRKRGRKPRSEGAASAWACPDNGPTLGTILEKFLSHSSPWVLVTASWAAVTERLRLVAHGCASHSCGARKPEVRVLAWWGLVTPLLICRWPPRFTRTWQRTDGKQLSILIGVLILLGHESPP